MTTRLNEDKDDEAITDKEDDANKYYDDEDVEEYEFKTNVNRRLSEILNIPPIDLCDNIDWEPPKEYGINNSECIIPSYYYKNNKILDINYYDIIKDDIRNFRALNNYQMEYIQNIPDEYKNELFIIFNQCIKTFGDFF
jgi:hypothetical protein